MPNKIKKITLTSYKTGGKVKRKKYALGSPVPYSPDQAIAQSQINAAKAAKEAMDDPTAIGLNIFGALASQVGSSLMSKGLANGEGADGEGLAGFLAKNQGTIQGGLGVLQGMSNSGFATGGKVRKKYNTGGITQKVPINAEGNEIVETPGGEPMELQGASHDNGGIDLTVPAGTEIYSQRLKGPDGKTMAARKKSRENKEASLGKTLQGAPTDKLLRNAYSRTKKANAVVDAEDMNKMKVAQMISEIGQTYALGGPVEPLESFLKPVTYSPDLPSTQLLKGSPFYQPIKPLESFLNPVTYSTPEPTVAPGNQVKVTPTAVDVPSGFSTGLKTVGDVLGDATSNITFGDALGLYGQYKAATDPMKNTLRQRSTDQPNINAYKDYGKKGLNELEKAKAFLAGEKASSLKGIVSDQVAASSRNRAGARGINTLRALDIATDAQAQRAKESVNNKYAEMLSNIFEKASGLYNQQDQMVMQGEEKRIAADAADKDAYYTALAKDIATRNTGTQYIAKNINEMKTRKTTGELINKLSANFDIDPMTGKVTKNGVAYGSVGDYELEPGTGKIIHKKTKKEIKE